jgi:hypothetical protein
LEAAGFAAGFVARLKATRSFTSASDKRATLVRFTAFSGGVTVESLRVMVRMDSFDVLEDPCDEVCAARFGTAYDGDAAVPISVVVAGGIDNAWVANFGATGETVSDCATCAGAEEDVATDCVAGFGNTGETDMDCATCVAVPAGVGRVCVSCLCDTLAFTTGVAATTTAVAACGFSDAISACQAATAGVTDAVFLVSASFIEQVTSSHVSAIVQPAKMPAASK